MLCSGHFPIEQRYQGRSGYHLRCSQCFLRVDNWDRIPDHEPVKPVDPYESGREARVSKKGVRSCPFTDAEDMGLWLQGYLGR